MDEQTQLSVVDVNESQTPMALIQMAVEDGADPEKLERLMGLQERWEANNARKQFFAAMADFQSKCPPIPKDGSVHGSGGKLMYRFARLETIIKVIRKVEQECGFRHRWDQEELESGGVRVLCEVTHVGGHSEVSNVTIPPAKGMNTNAAQDRGIIIKYGKRYSLLNAYGLEPDDDTDTQPLEKVEYLTDAQVRGLNGLLDEIEQYEPGSKKRFSGWLEEKIGVDSLTACPKGSYDAIRKAVSAKLNEVSK